MSGNNIYLKEIRVENYKSLKDSVVELQKGLNIIIGKNGAGKSNLLDFIYKYGGKGVFRLPLRTATPNFSISVSYDVESTNNVFIYSIERARRDDIADQDYPYNLELILKQPVSDNTPEEISKLSLPIPLLRRRLLLSRRLAKTTGRNELDILNSLDRKHIAFELPRDAFWVSKPNRLTIDQDSNFEDDISGFSFFKNLESRLEFAIDVENEVNAEIKGDITFIREYLFNFINKYIETSSINVLLNDYSPITEIRLNPNLNIYANEDTIIVENISIDFLINGDWMPWSYLSDGTKRLFYLISECITLERGIILVEEPEIGIHPHQLLKILDFLREQSQTKQVIISTHSPLSLDILEENELSQIIIAKYEKGTKFYKLKEEEIIKAKRYINEVGELSYYWLHSDLEK